MLNLLFDIKEAIQESFAENEFGSMGEHEVQIINLRLSGSLNQTISCFYQKFCNDHTLAQFSTQRSIQDNLKVIQLSNTRENKQMSHDIELKQLSISYNNQAVIELKKGNALYASQISKSSVQILESQVYRQISSSLTVVKKETIYPLMIAYFNLGVSLEMMHGLQDTTV